MAEHWCKEHQMAWFKKGKMRGYAHPILDEDGEKTDNWCNEPKSEVESKPPESPRSGSTNDSIESQVAFKGMIELIVADKIAANSPTGIATIVWAITRLGGKDVPNKVSTKETGRVSGEEIGQGSGGFDEEWWLSALTTLDNKPWIAEQLKLLGVTVKQGQRYIEAIKALDGGKQALLKNGVELALAYL